MTSRLATFLQRTTERQWRLAFAGLVLLLLTGVLLPGELKADIEGSLWNDFPWSAAAHFSLFATIAAFPVYGLGRKGIWRALLLALLLGAFTELAQSLVPGRHPMVRDVLIDLSGTTLGLFLQQPITRLVHESPRVG